MMIRRLTGRGVTNISLEPFYFGGAVMDWHAIDDDRYDVDCDYGAWADGDPGWVNCDHVGTGKTAEMALADLLEQIEEGG